MIKTQERCNLLIIKSVTIKKTHPLAPSLEKRGARYKDDLEGAQYSLKFILILILFFLFLFSFLDVAVAQKSVARQWNEVLLTAIRNDFARPTVHARNLFHVSVAMYDAWAAYDETANTYLFPKSDVLFNNVDSPQELQAAREEAISYATYRLLNHRFQFSPGADESLYLFDSLFVELGYDSLIISLDYSSGSPAELGNYIAQQLIDLGLNDGAHEQFGYGNFYYDPINSALDPIKPGNPDLQYPNRWQPLTLGTFIDQSGHEIPISTPEFLSAEWGEVKSFALVEEDLSIYQRDGYDYRVFHDPGPPPYIDTMSVGGVSDQYKWGFELVSIWSSHLDPKSEVMVDVSPASIGNISELPESITEYSDFYNFINGSVSSSIGHTLNPHTGLPYEPQIVPLGDYARILAEFWADGPDSETPPGHWFTLLNYVNDHPDFEKRFRGTGAIVEDLEWDVKAYFVMGGAVHDAAIAAWGIKGWYDYIRPISAIRSMADRGQSTDENLPNYHPGGIQLVENFIELVAEDDSLAVDSVENIGKIKLYSWRGHDYITDPSTESAGVGWILAENWWPYQRPSFVTPPFAGYVSGHSTFSRAAAEVMTLLTGDEYFPGGMAEFYCKKNEFLVFEEGPSMDITLQWATYRDASDECSLSRIWGGIHPPADDIPGRKIGIKVGLDAFNLAEKYFSGQITSINNSQAKTDRYSFQVFPNPARMGNLIKIKFNQPISNTTIDLYNVLGQVVSTQKINRLMQNGDITISTNSISTGLYFLKVSGGPMYYSQKILIIK
jgi:hypothetical protein